MKSTRVPLPWPLAIALLLAGCANKNAPSPPIRLGIDSQAVVSLLPMIAESEHLWSKHGVDVTFQRYPSGAAAAQALVGGAADVATMADFPFVLASTRRGDLRVFLTIAQSPLQVQVVANSSRGIHSVADLAGHGVGVTIGSAGEFYLHELAAARGIQSSSIRSVGLSPQEMLNAMASGKDLDAACTWQPFVFRIRQALGPRAVVFASRDIYNLSFTLVAGISLLDRSEPRIQGIVAALTDARNEWRDHPDRAAGILSSYSGLTREELNAILPDYNFGLSSDPGLPKLLAREERWARGAGLVPANTAPVDWASRIDSRFTPASAQ